MNWLRTRIARQPKGAMVLGKALFLAGGILVLAAQFARIRLVALNTERAATQLPPLQTLAEAFVQAPTWMVPEGPVGYCLAAALVLAGMGLIVMAERTARR